MSDIKFRRATSNESDLEIGANSNVTSNWNDAGVGHVVIHNDKKLRRSSIVTIILLVSLWYSAAILSITTSKCVLNVVQFPFLLCTFQFSMAAIITRSYLSFHSKFKSIQESFSTLIYEISLSYTFGFIFTNISFSLGKLFNIESSF